MIIEKHNTMASSRDHQIFRPPTHSDLVCVFAGGTSGIGEATLKAFTAKETEFSIYIIGRNESKAAQIIQECGGSDPRRSITFLKTDLTLLRNVDKVCAEIQRRESRLDLLFMSQGYLTLQGKNG